MYLNFCKNKRADKNRGMPGTIAFPTIVEQALEDFGGFFANEPQRKHFGEYLTGLLIAELEDSGLASPTL